MYLAIKKTNTGCSEPGYDFSVVYGDQYFGGSIPSLMNANLKSPIGLLAHGKRREFWTDNAERFG